VRHILWCEHSIHWRCNLLTDTFVDRIVVLHFTLHPLNRVDLLGVWRLHKAYTRPQTGLWRTLGAFAPTHEPTLPSLFLYRDGHGFSRRSQERALCAFRPVQPVRVVSCHKYRDPFGATADFPSRALDFAERLHCCESLQRQITTTIHPAAWLTLAVTLWIPI
jgi:hypothetical protein